MTRLNTVKFNSVSFVISAWLAALVPIGCGGDTSSARVDELPALEPVEDTGGNPADCSAEDGYDIEWLEDWESGSGPWYTNNDICEPCNDLITDIDTLGRMRDCFDAAQAALGDAAGDGGISESARDAVKAEFKNCPEDPQVDIESDTLSDDLQQAYDKAVETREANLEGLKECRGPCEASQTPSFFVKPVAASRIIGGQRCGSLFAFNVDTIRLQLWGLTVGRQFSLSEPKDLSAFDGILFWARRGPNAPSELKISLADPYTEERALDENGNQPCTYDAPYDDSSEGCDKFGKRVKLSLDWQLFVVPFKEMRQDGFGKVAPLLKLDEILGVSFDTRPGDNDLWIDDVGFYRKK